MDQASSKMGTLGQARQGQKVKNGREGRKLKKTLYCLLVSIWTEI